MKQKKIFVSYCRNDVNLGVLKLVLDAIEEKLKKKLNFNFDEKLNAGDNLDDFMNLIQQSSAILVFLTPKYNAKVQAKQNSGVYTEYCQINSLLENSECQIPIIPILLSGNKEESCPFAFKNKLYADLTNKNLDVMKGEGQSFKVTKYSKPHFEKELMKIQGAIEAGLIQHTKEFQAEYEQLKSELFMDRKGENIFTHYKEDNLIDIIVKTQNYLDVLNQKSYILMGRKGSGKSTIVNAISRLDRNAYKCFCVVDLNNFSLSRLFGIISTPRNRSENDFVLPYKTIFKNSWDIFISFCCISMLKYSKKNGKLSPNQENNCQLIFDFFESTKGTKNEKVEILDEKNKMVVLGDPAIFTWSVISVYEKVNEFIQNSRSSNEADFLHDIETLNDEEKLKSLVIPIEIQSALEKVSEECKKKFFISLDGFDNSFEDFRRETAFRKENNEQVWERNEFENAFLSSFLQKTIEIKTRNVNSHLYQNIDFCIMVPRDRFISIRRAERDSYIYRDKYSEISWSGPELALMLRKRLEVINGYSHKSSGKKLSPFDSLNNVLDVCYPNLPLYTTTHVGGKEYRKHIFLDVLRHTFWRPRDILYYFAAIITLLDNYKKRHWQIDSDAILHSISEVIANITDNVIKDEFIGEFKSYFTNIEDVINVFMKSKQVLDYNEIKKALGNIPFNFAYESEDSFDFIQKLKFLHEIGFIGIRLDKSLMSKHRITISDVFFFSYGRYFLDKLVKNDELKTCKIVIHPIFCEYLDLNTENQDLTLNFDSEYLVKNEIMRARKFR